MTRSGLCERKRRLFKEIAPGCSSLGSSISRDVAVTMIAAKPRRSTRKPRNWGIRRHSSDMASMLLRKMTGRGIAGGDELLLEGTARQL
jgi:hypothetical protein